MEVLQYYNYGQLRYAIVSSVNRLASSFCPFYSLLQPKSSTLTPSLNTFPQSLLFFPVKRMAATIEWPFVWELFFFLWFRKDFLLGQNLRTRKESEKPRDNRNSPRREKEGDTKSRTQGERRRSWKSWAILILLRCIRNCGAFVIKLQGQRVTPSLAVLGKQGWCLRHTPL